MRKPEVTFMNTRLLSLLPLAAILAGCGTAEYRQERSVCQARWSQIIPPDYYDTLVEQMRAERRPTGRTECITRGNRTICEDQMMTIYVPYTRVVTVDGAKPERDAEVQNCVAQACLARFGNLACE